MDVAVLSRIDEMGRNLESVSEKTVAVTTARRRVSTRTLRLVARP